MDGESGDAGVGEGTLPAGSGGDMVPTLADGEGASSAPVAPPQTLQQNAGQSHKTRTKISDILSRLDGLESRLTGTPSQTSSSVSPSSGMGPSGPSGPVEEIGDDLGETSEADAGGVASAKTGAKTES